MTTLLSYEPNYKGIVPLHTVDSWLKVRQIIRALRAGNKIPPIVCIDGCAINGTHRLAANALQRDLGRDERVPVVYGSRDELSESTLAML